MGNFSDSYYDKSVIQELKCKLSITGDFDLALLYILPEEFMSALFEVMSPFVFMYEDILDFYKRCEAVSNTENIEIEFNTSRCRTELRTDAIIKPVGKGRKTAIQPDYSVVCGKAEKYWGYGCCGRV